MRILPLLTTMMIFSFSLSSYATEEEDLAEMQKQMNAEVMSKPFLAEQTEKVNAYIKEAMKKNIKPKVYKGNHWRRGYTCRDMLRWSWTEYRNCRYYYTYHGSYYPYY
ncbi:hypothetical protein MNBD_GAMMA22-1646 [hydrothermal vent metagenome]|uniref:Uncharacterized protein n=1 Tax=hydrothermal vent metagenome TaxID=652676 RepID=A0A3B1A4Y4_9ZZZZ